MSINSFVTAIIAEALGSKPGRLRRENRPFAENLSSWKKLSTESGSPAWIRTTIHGSKGRCPTVRRPGKEVNFSSLAHAATMREAALNRCGSQFRPVPGPDFKPGVRYLYRGWVRHPLASATYKLFKIIKMGVGFGFQGQCRGNGLITSLHADCTQADPVSATFEDLHRWIPKRPAHFRT